MDIFEERNALKVEVARLREVLAAGERERDKVRDGLVDHLTKVAERIGQAVERLGIGTADDCRVDDPNRGYLTAVENLYNAAASARTDRDALSHHALTLTVKVARLQEALDHAYPWVTCGHDLRVCPTDAAGELIEDDCKASKRFHELVKGVGS